MAHGEAGQPPWRQGAHLRVRRRGEKRRAALSMAETNAKHTLMRYKVRTSYDDKRINNALLQLESALALDAPPMRIECFDISTIHGSLHGGLDGGVHERQARQESVPPLQDQDAARRGERLPVHAGGAWAAATRPERMADERFGSKPDLIIVDGGKPQLHGGARRMFEQLGHRRSQRCAAWPSATRSCSCRGRTRAPSCCPAARRRSTS